MAERNSPRVDSMDDLSSLLGVAKHDIYCLAACDVKSYRTVTTTSRSGKVRTFYIASVRLATIQCRIRDWLKSFPLHDAAHGWRAGRSQVTAARPHVGKPLVINLDIKDCYPSASSRSIYNLFAEIGCAADVARLLTRLTTCDGHLVQGLHTSPIIANLLLSKVDRRIDILCRKLKFRYSRFGDDLTMSGSKGARQLVRVVSNILSQSGFTINEDKFRERGLQPSTGRQEVVGIIVNQKMNLPKERRRQYRAIIHNCWVKGPQSELEDGESIEQLRRRLQGYVSYFAGINPTAANGLREKLRKVEWASAASRSSH